MTIDDDVKHIDKCMFGQSLCNKDNNCDEDWFLTSLGNLVIMIENDTITVLTKNRVQGVNNFKAVREV